MTLRLPVTLFALFLSGILAVPHAQAQFVLTQSTPIRNASDISIHTTITLGFNEAVDLSTAANGISVRSSLRGSVPGTFSITASSLLFTPATPLRYGEQIDVVARPTLRAASGKNLAAAATLTFVTEVKKSAATPPVFSEANLASEPNSIFSAMTAVDLDLDGDIDIVYSRSTEVGWLENNGASTFARHVLDLPANVPEDVKAGDLDNDGDIDLAIADYYSGIVIAINDGAQNFEATGANYATCMSLEIADFDANGLLDIIYSDFTTSKSWIMYNQDGHTFQKNAISNTVSSKICIADMDADGDLDAVQNGNETIYLLRNNGNTFATPEVISTQSAYDLLVGDFNGDHTLDVATAAEAKITIFANHGTLPFDPTEIATDTYSNYLTAGDYDGDKDLDIIIPYYYGFQMFENNGQGAFTPREIMNTLTGHPGYFEFTLGTADVDSDGVMDFFATSSYYLIQWYRNSTLEQVFPFALQAHTIDKFNYGDADWGDYDMDGDLDLVTLGIKEDAGQAITNIYENTNGTLQKKDTGIPNLSIGSCDWGDYDNDGDLDLLLIGSTGYDNMYNAKKFTGIYTNHQGTFTLLPTSTQLPQTYHGEARWADFDNDGKLDIVFNAMSATAMYRNTGTGFEKRYALPSLFTDGNVALADYDGDGDTDVAVSGWRGNDELGAMLKVFVNQGNWTFTEAEGEFLGLVGGDLRWADMDNDGDVDLVAAGTRRTFSIPSITVYANQSGKFQALTNSEPLYDTDSNGSAITADFDNNGTTDVMAANLSSLQANTLLRNTGTGDLKSLSVPTPGLAGNHMSVIDIDNDHDLDLFQGRQWLINNAATPNTRPLPPAQLSDSLYNNTLYVYWTPGSDAQTPAASLTYAVYAGTASQQQDVLSARASVPSGIRHVSEPGFASGKVWKIANIPAGTCYYGVQSIDGGLESSTFVEQQTSFIRIDGTTAACHDGQYTYKATPAGTYTWKVTGGTIVSGQGSPEVTVRWEESGNNFINTTNSSGRKNTLPVIVDEQIAPGLSGNLTVCTGEEQYEITDPLSAHFTWKVDGQYVLEGGNKQQVTINWTTAGSHTIETLVSSVNYGCAVTGTHLVDVDTRPAPTLEGPSKVCVGDQNVVFTSNSQHSTWSVTGGTIVQSSNQSAAISWQNEKDDAFVYLKETSEHAYCATSVTLPVKINPVPNTPTIERRSTSLRSSSAATYQWYIDNAAVPFNKGGSEREIELIRSGTYRVVVSNLVGCTAPSDDLVITDVVTGTEQLVTNGFKLFPNPATTHTTLEITTPQPCTISLYDLNSRLVKQIDVSNPRETLRLNIDTSDLAPGYYTIVLRSTQDVKYAKLIKRTR